MREMMEVVNEDLGFITEDDLAPKNHKVGWFCVVVSFIESRRSMTVLVQSKDIDASFWDQLY